MKMGNTKYKMGNSALQKRMRKNTLARFYTSFCGARWDGIKMGVRRPGEAGCSNPPTRRALDLC